MAVKTGEKADMPLIPDIRGLTLAVQENLAKSECADLLTTLNSHFEKDGCNDPTIEDMLTHIRTLRSVAGKDRVRNLTANDLDILDDHICKSIRQIVDKELPDTKTPYHCIASWVEAVTRDRPVEVFTTKYCSPEPAQTYMLLVLSNAVQMLAPFDSGSPYVWL